MDQKLIKIIESLKENRYPNLTKDEVLDLVENNSQGDILFLAEKIVQKTKGNTVFLCSILNAKSGVCEEDCAFCAQSEFHDTGVSVYPLLSEKEIIEKALFMHEKGATHFSIVTSGYALTDSDIERVCSSVKTIKEKTDLTLCGSLGMLSLENARKLVQSGMERYHHNLETAPSHFDKICTTHSYKEDIQTVLTAKKAGFKVCSGGIFGLGESLAQRVEFAFTLKELDVDTVPVNFLSPVKGTKLEKQKILDPLEALFCIALVRIVNPEKSVTICGGREITLKDFQSWVFKAGANGLMIGNYLTTQGRNIEDDLDMIRDANKKIG